MKETLLLLANYNIWANKKLIDVMLKQSNEVLDMEITSSFNSIRQTAYHMWGAEDIWLQRLLLTEQPVWAPSVFDGDMQQACNNWMKTSKSLLQFVEKQFDDNAFSHVFQYYNLKKQSSKNTVGNALLQVFNHATYHRGQLVTMLRQAGITKIPGTDFMLFKK